jgi:hypothetical protein
MSPTIVEIIETGSAAPSQWELTLSDGRFAYVRYRHSKLSVGVGATMDDAVDRQVTCTLTAPFVATRECTWEEAEPYVLSAIAAQSLD